MPKPRNLAVCSVLVFVIALLASGCGSSSSDGTTSAGGSVNQKLHDLLPQQVRESGVLKVATDPEYPPCDFTNSAGQVDGFNHDLLVAMGRVLGVKIQQPAISFDGLLPGVQSGRFDAAMECITDNAERQKTVKFVDYAYATLSNMTVAANPKNITENPLSLCGLHAGVQTGTEFVGDVERFSKNCEQSGKSAITITNFPSASSFALSLKSEGAPIEYAFMAEPTVTNRFNFGAVAAAPHPNAARLFMN